MLLIIQRFWLTLTIWIAVISVLFSWSFFLYHHDARYLHVRKILGLGLCVSRGTVTILHICTALLVIPVCRTLHLIVARIGLPKYFPVFITAILNRCKIFHFIVAITLMIFSVIHTISHMVNAYYYAEFFDSTLLEVNWASYKGQNSWILIFTSFVGLTGIAMIIILLIMGSFSVPKVRMRQYNLFWFSHHLGILYLLLYIIHPLSGVIKETVCENINNEGCNKVMFQAPGSKAWIWACLPLILLLLDYFTRFLSTRKESLVAHVAALPGNAVEIYFSAKDTKFMPGQYILLQCSAVSTLEWHPYTIIDCPSIRKNQFSVIIRMRGDWSNSVCREVLKSSRRADFHAIRTHIQPTKFYITGPFASNLQCILSCEHVICIAAGVGITPFASVMRYLLENDVKYPERLHLIWLTPDPHQILWFAWTITMLHNKCWRENKPERFQFSIYITRDFTEVSERYPLVSCRMYQGRPNWTTVFGDLNSEFYIKHKVKVFACASNKLINVISEHCQQSKFKLIRETYS